MPRKSFSGGKNPRSESRPDERILTQCEIDELLADLDQQESWMQEGLESLPCAA